MAGVGARVEAGVGALAGAALPAADVAGARPAALGATREQSIDRLRVLVSGAVVCVHATIGAASPLFAAMPAGDRLASNLLRSVVEGFSVNSFLVIAFLLVHRSVERGVRWRDLMGKRLRTVVPGFLFWSAVYVGLRAAWTREVPAPSSLDDIVFLGAAADHLYYVPLLLFLTATYPLVRLAAARPRVGIAAGLALSAAAHLWGARLAGGNHYLQLVTGAAGVAVFPVLGFAMARSWGGAAAPARLRPWIVAGGLAVALIATAVIARGMAAEAVAGAQAPRSQLLWACSLLRGVALSVSVLSLRLPDSRFVAWLGPLTFGVYLVHPIFLVGLRTVEGALLGSGTSALLIVPNAVLAFTGSALLVFALSRTRLRRLVTTA